MPTWDPQKSEFEQNAAIANLTDNSGGVASGVVAAVPVAYDQAELANALASIIAKQNAILAALRAANIIDT